MAEFLEQETPEADEGFDAMGKPIPLYRRQAAQHDCKAMGLEDSGQIFECVQSVAQRLERDDPYGAMEQGTKYLDLTGTYRLMAVLLTAERTQ